VFLFLVFPMICCCWWWLVLLGTGNRSARIIKISRFFKFFFILFGWRRLLVSTSAREGRKAGRQAGRKKKIRSRAKLLGFWTTTTAYNERERRERERERSCRTGGRLALRLIPSGLLIPIALFMKLFLLLLLLLFCGEILLCVVFFLVFLH
jgi:hypothetical protein